MPPFVRIFYPETAELVMVSRTFETMNQHKSFLPKVVFLEYPVTAIRNMTNTSRAVRHGSGDGFLDASPLAFPELLSVNRGSVYNDRYAKPSEV